MPLRWVIASGLEKFQPRRNITAEAAALGIAAPWATVRIIPGEPEPPGRAESPQSKLLWFLGLTALVVGGLIWLGS